MKKATDTAKETSSKVCIRCGRVLPLSNFYPNRMWAQQLYHDAWCRECFEKYCRTPEDLKVYCWQNNRKWEDRYWDSAKRTARPQLNTNQDLLNPKLSDKKREEIEGALICRGFTRIMNMKQMYFYEPHDVVDERKEEQVPDDDPKKLIWSDEWRGFYTRAQIHTLDEIYAQYEEDFDLDNVNIRDYAHKIAKASFNADIAEDRMRRGDGDPGTYKEMQRIFDDMSKSATFAACRRKPGDRTGLGSLGEIILRLEVDGKLNVDGVTFPEDDIDRVIADFRHTLTAVGAQGGLT